MSIISFDFGTVINIMGLIAVAVFAISGSLEAARQRMDILGFMLVGTATGIGGGTLRDVLLGSLPVFWVKEPIWIVICLTSSSITYFIAPQLSSRLRTLLWMDAVGIALFSVVGTKVAMEFGANPLIAISMGVMTATFGGIARDVICSSNLTLMNEELYITTTLVGSVTYFLLNSLNVQSGYDLFGGFLIAFILRALAIRYNIKLPNHIKEQF